MKKKKHFEYSRKYFLSDCEGHIQFNNSRGKVLGKRLNKIFKLARIRPGMKVLDVGCGRGELVLHMASFKTHAWGIDSSGPAIDICLETLNFWERQAPGIKQYARFLNRDARHLDFETEFFDVIILSDIVEHLEAKQLNILFNQIGKILKKNGKIIIHTSPNKFYLPFSGFLFFFISVILAASRSHFHQRIIHPNLRRRLPPGLAKEAHVNEQSSFGLKRSLRKNGLRVEKIWFELNPHYIDKMFSDPRGFRIINSLKKIMPGKHLFHADIFCIAAKP